MPMSHSDLHVQALTPSDPGGFGQVVKREAPMANVTVGLGGPAERVDVIRYAHVTFRWCAVFETVQRLVEHRPVVHENAGGHRAARADLPPVAAAIHPVLRQNHGADEIAASVDLGLRPRRAGVADDFGGGDELVSLQAAGEPRVRTAGVRAGGGPGVENLNRLRSTDTRIISE